MDRVMRRFTAFLSIAAICAALAAESAAAEQCGGTDMLAELAEADPGVHRKILDEAAATENANALLWKIEKQGTAPSYLFGTIHLSDSRATTLPKVAEEVLSTAKTVVLEVADASEAAMTAAMIGQSELIFYSDGRSLADKLSPEDFRKVETVAASAGMPEGFARAMRPWLVSTLLSTSECERKQIAAGVPVLDLAIAAKAKAKDIPLVGLETVDEQLVALSGIPESEQIEMLTVGLRYLERRNDMLETMLQMYLKRQMGAAMPFQIALAGKVGVGPSAFAGFEKMLLTDRNAGMSRDALPHLEKGGAFIAVGALHLLGKNGLVAHFRSAGYTVTAAE